MTEMTNGLDWLSLATPTHVAMLGLALLPMLLVLGSKRSSGWRKGAWALVTQLPWLFVALYAWVWLRRYGADTEAPPMDGAFGWWLLGFPWAVYGLYLATRVRGLTRVRKKPAS
ncbi:MAG TPA: hypothetical protein VGE57_04030 [Solimonas sp.]